MKNQHTVDSLKMLELMKNKDIVSAESSGGDTVYREISIRQNGSGYYIMDATKYHPFDPRFDQKHNGPVKPELIEEMFSSEENMKMQWRVQYVPEREVHKTLMAHLHGELSDETIGLVEVVLIGNKSVEQAIASIDSYVQKNHLLIESIWKFDMMSGYKKVYYS